MYDSSLFFQSLNKLHLVRLVWCIEICLCGLRNGTRSSKVLVVPLISVRMNQDYQLVISWEVKLKSTTYKIRQNREHCSLGSCSASQKYLLKAVCMLRALLFKLFQVLDIFLSYQRSSYF